MLSRLCYSGRTAQCSKIPPVSFCHVNQAPRNFSSHKRALSPVAALANNATPQANPRPQTPTSVSPRVAARNVLKSTLNLVPRTLSHEHQRLWEQRARSALDELEVGRSRPLRVAVWGDEISGANEIVTGLLDDPLSDDADQRNMLRQRWASVPQNGVIRIKRNERASWDGQTLQVKSNWLQNINAEIIECRDPNALDTLLSCDHIILVTDNLRRLLAPGLQNILQGLVHAPSVNLVITERAPGVVVPPDSLNGINPAVVKPELAVQGLEAFARGDINRYQALLIASGLPQFAQEISNHYAQSNQPSAPSSTASLAVVRTAAHIARTTLSACEAAIGDAQKSLSTTVAPLDPLKADVAAVGPAAFSSVLQGTTTVREGVSVVETRLRTAFARLPWYSLWWRADEVASTLGEAINWGSLSTQLSFHAGRLASIRQRMHTRAVALAVSSPVLNNRLAQVHARTPIGPDSLSSPLVQRTAQLLAPGGPVEDAQRRAQAAVMTTAMNILGSGALSTGLFAIGSISAGTAIGAGLLGSVASVRWMQSMWARTEKRWWADWTRVCAGLERDCEAALNQVVRERVVGSAAAGIEGLEALTAQRAKAISALRGEVLGLNQEIAEIGRAHV